MQGCDIDGSGQPSTSGQGSSEEAWETRTASRDDPGFIVFDGGNYSWGPTSLLHPPPLQVRHARSVDPSPQACCLEASARRLPRAANSQLMPGTGTTLEPHQHFPPSTGVDA